LIGIIDDDVVASTSWISVDSTPVSEIGAWFTPPPGSAYIWDCATRPTHQGRGLYGLLLGRVVGWLFHTGIERAWIAADVGNTRSTGGIIRAGFRLHGIVLARKVGPCTFRDIVEGDGDEKLGDKPLRASISTNRAGPEVDADRSARVASGNHRQWSHRPRRGGRFLATDDRSTQRPGADPFDPNVREAA
jgi:hypothetical protein